MERHLEEPILILLRVFFICDTICPTEKFLIYKSAK